MKYGPKAAGGFTLIEVLIASIILFLAIAIASVSYRSSLASIHKISEEYDVLKVADRLRANIEAVEQNNFQAKKSGTMAGFEYQWNVVSEVVRDEFTGIDQETYQRELPQIRYSLQTIRLLIFRDTNRSKSWEFEFKNLKWQSIESSINNPPAQF